MDDVTYRDKILISNYTIECLHSQKLILVSNYAMECLHFHRKPENLFFLSVGKFHYSKDNKCIIKLNFDLRFLSRDR